MARIEQGTKNKEQRGGLLGAAVLLLIAVALLLAVQVMLPGFGERAMIWLLGVAALVTVMIVRWIKPTVSRPRQLWWAITTALVAGIVVWRLLSEAESFAVLAGLLCAAIVAIVYTAFDDKT